MHAKDGRLDWREVSLQSVGFLSSEIVFELALYEWIGLFWNEFIGFHWIMIAMNWTPIGLNWTILFKCLEMTFLVIWRYINKTELNWIILKHDKVFTVCSFIPLDMTIQQKTQHGLGFSRMIQFQCRLVWTCSNKCNNFLAPRVFCQMTESLQLIIVVRVNQQKVQVLWNRLIAVC